jgi:electron transfer flavoprotein beta subunit
MAVPLISPAASFSVAEGALAFTAETEEGTVSGKTSPPAVIVARKGMNTPRYPSVRARMAARKKEIVVKHPADSARSSPKTRLLSMAPPPARTPGRIIEAATPEEKAEKLIDLLAGEAGVL